MDHFHRSESVELAVELNVIAPLEHIDAVGGDVCACAVRRRDL